jgi:hydrogenase maturation protein HypF
MDARGSRSDRAGSMVHAMVRGLVDIASEKAEDEGIDHIGLSGGVSYNRAISTWTKELVEARGLKFVCHDLTPNGDGCISRAVRSGFARPRLKFNHSPRNV